MPQGGDRRRRGARPASERDRETPETAAAGSRPDDRPRPRRRARAPRVRRVAARVPAPRPGSGDRARRAGRGRGGIRPPRRRAAHRAETHPAARRRDHGAGDLVPARSTRARDHRLAASDGGGQRADLGGRVRDRRGGVLARAARGGEPVHGRAARRRARDRRLGVGARGRAGGPLPRQVGHRAESAVTREVLHRRRPAVEPHGGPPPTGPLRPPQPRHATPLRRSARAGSTSSPAGTFSSTSTGRPSTR